MVEKALGEGRPWNEAGCRFMDKRQPLSMFPPDGSPEGLTQLQRYTHVVAVPVPPYSHMKLAAILGPMPLTEFAPWTHHVYTWPEMTVPVNDVQPY